MTFLNIYIIGAYLTILAYCMLLESASFRDYLEFFLEDLKRIFNIKYDLYCPYAEFKILTFIISLFSWIGLIIIIMLAIDYFGWMAKNKNKM